MSTFDTHRKIKASNVERIYPCLSEDYERCAVIAKRAGMGVTTVGWWMPALLQAGKAEVSFVYDKRQRKLRPLYRKKLA